MPDVRARRPADDEYGGPFAKYIALVSETDVEQMLADQLGALLALLRPLTQAQAAQLHPPYSWTMNEVVGHITDCERVFAYRTLCAARGDTTTLPSFDENLYALNQRAKSLPLPALLDEFEFVRQSTLALLKLADDEAWLRRGTASGVVLSVRAWAYVMTGHARHHLAIIERRLGAR